MSAPKLSLVCASVVLALVARPTARSAAQEGVKESDRITAAIAVLGEVMGASDSAVPGSILERAEAIAVFPSLVKAGFGQRRKMLRRSLANLVDPEAFEDAAIDPTARAEELDIVAWGRLAAAARPR